MKNILLINSPFVFSTKEIHLTEPLGLEYLSSSLKKNGYNVFIADSRLCKPRKIRDNLYSYDFDINNLITLIETHNIYNVGISCHYSFAAPSMYILAEKIKRYFPNITIIVGGLYISVYEEKALNECEYIDCALIGESENTLINYLDEKHPFSIEGFIFRDRIGNKPIKNKKCNYIKDLDSLPFPDRNLQGLKQYMEGSKIKKLYGLGGELSLSILTSRSCPYNCSFCNMKLVHGNKWRSRSVENVIEEMNLISKKYKAKHMFVVDDNFTFDIDRAKNICKSMIKNKYNLKWNTPNGISVKKMDLELATLMKKSGCASVCIAIESGSEYIRTQVMNKKISNEDIVNAINCFNKVNIPVIGYVIVGMLEETEDRYIESYNFLKELKLSSVVVSYATPFPRTKFNDDLIKEGILGEYFSLGLDDLNTPIFETWYFTKKDIIKRKNEIKNLFPGLSIIQELIESK